MGATDLSWSLGADWVEFKKGINDAKSFSEKALYDISHSAARSLILFSSPIDTRRVQAALTTTSLFAKNLGIVFTSSYGIYKLTLGKLPNLFKPVGDKFGEMGAKIRSEAAKIRKAQELAMSPAEFKKYREFYKNHPLLDMFVHGKKDMVVPSVWGKQKKDVTSFGAIFGQVSKKVIDWAKQMGSHIFNIGVQIAKIVLLIGGTAALLGTILAGILAKMMDTGKVLDDVSRASGIAGKEILTVQYMLVRMGASAEQASGILTEMRAGLLEASTGFGDAARWAAFMGLNIGNLLRMKPSEAFEKIAGALGKLNGYQKGLAAKSLLGGSGADVVAQVRGLKETIAMYGKIIDAVDTNKSEMAGLVVAWQNIRAIATGFFAIMASRVAKDLRGIFEGIAGWMSQSLDFAEKLGDKLDAAVRVVTHIFTDKAKDSNDTPFQRIIEILKAGFDVAVERLGNLIRATILSIKPLLVWVFESAIPFLIKGLVKAGGALWNVINHSDNFNAYKDQKATEAESYRKQAAQEQAEIDRVNGKSIKGSTDDAYIKALENLKQADLKHADVLDKQAKSGEGFAGGDSPATLADALRESAKAFVEGLKGGKETEADKKLQALIDKYNQPVASGPLPAKQGAGGATLRSPTFLNVFDELRKIGGGLGNTGKLVQGNQMLDETKKVVLNTDRTAQYLEDLATTNQRIGPGIRNVAIAGTANYT